MKENRQVQRNMERFVLMFYSLYTISLSGAAIWKEWETWIPWLMMGALAVSWVAFFTQYKNFRTRTVINTVMMQVTIILHAVHMDDIVAVMPIFIAFIILVAYYGNVRLMRLTLFSVVIIAFYHGVIIDTFSVSSTKELVRLLSQAANILCVEFLLHFWLKRRSENDRQIYEVIEALMEAEQSKDDFLANVSHEIRTPVNTISGMSEMALREHDPEKMRDEVLNIRDAGHNLMSIVSDILDFSQLQQGKMDIEEEAYNITSTMNDIINMAMARKGDKPIELIVDCDADIPSGLLGDEKKIRRVIMNLVDNAIKFTSEGGVIISVNARKENYGVNLCVSVRDTGIGIGEGSQETLFQSFSQVDAKRNRQEGGVGLGLAISRALVHKMGGTITVRSRLGKGSIFRIVIPQKVLTEEPVGRVDNREKLNIAAYFDMEQFDMMAIRDEYSNLIIHMIQQLRVKCHVCRNLAELKRRQENDPFSHVFISLEEYQEDESYFDELAKRAKVIVVIERPNAKYVSNPDFIRLYKPLYILPVISILNGDSGSEVDRQMVRTGKFTAPKAHILVVDDNRMNIRVIEGLLRDYKIKVSYATSGHEALEVIENMSYDFVFMDHMMPEMDGIETLHRIRNKVGPYYQKVPIIALTANAAPGNREMFLEEGFDDFVAKPVEISVLERVLRRNLPEEKLIFQTKENSGGANSRNINNRDVDDVHKLIVGDTASNDIGNRGIIDTGKPIADVTDNKDIGDRGIVDTGKLPASDSDNQYIDNKSIADTGKLIAGDTNNQDTNNRGIAATGKLSASDSDNQDIDNKGINDTAELVVGDLDVAQGTIYCGGREQYLDILEAYCEEGDEQCALIEKLYKEQDWKNYTIQVHALKGMMKNIGANPLSEKAKLVETAGKNNDIPYILQHHEDMILEHNRVMDELRQCPFIHVELPEADSANTEKSAEETLEPQENGQDLPELDEETFDRLLEELEDAVYSFDSGQMLDTVSKLQGYQYCHTSLEGKLEPVRKKIEMSDYMSAVDMVSKIRDSLKDGDGGSVNA